MYHQNEYRKCPCTSKVHRKHLIIHIAKWAKTVFVVCHQHLRHGDNDGTIAIWRQLALNYLRLRGDDAMMSGDDKPEEVMMKTNMVMIVLIKRVDLASVTTG